MASVSLLLCVLGSFLLLGMIFLALAIRIVQEDSRLSVYRLGRYLGDKGPGLVVLIPFVDRGVLKELGTANTPALQRLAGAVGETRTTVYTDGKVSVAGEEWDALSQSPISAGQRVRVVRMVLEVEKE
jgi:hypothetical protein